MPRISVYLRTPVLLAVLLVAPTAGATTCESQVTLFGMNDIAQPGGPDQLVRLDPSTGVGLPLHFFSPGNNDLEGLAYDPGLKVFWTTNSGFLLRFDPATYAETPIGATGYVDIDGLAVQPGTGTLFAITYGGNDLLILDKTDGHATLVNGHVEEGHRLEDLAFDCTGRLWILTSEALVEVNPATGAKLSSVTLSGATSMEALVWWEAQQTFLSAADRGGFKDLVRLDRTTGVATFVSASLHSGFVDIEALAFMPTPQVSVEPRSWGATKLLYR